MLKLVVKTFAFGLLRANPMLGAFSKPRQGCANALALNLSITMSSIYQSRTFRSFRTLSYIFFKVLCTLKECRRVDDSHRKGTCERLA